MKRIALLLAALLTACGGGGDEPEQAMCGPTPCAQTLLKDGQQ